MKTLSFAILTGLISISTAICYSFEPSYKALKLGNRFGIAFIIALIITCILAVKEEK